ncbi:MAG: Cell division protein FtsB [Gemmatimonadetes bacterium]|nr:Cell division protein FtsB [Gemmatimonadota bacterium]
MELTPRAARRLAAGALLLVAGYQAVFGGEYSAFGLLGLRDQAAERRAHLADTRRQVDSLRAVARRLERDDAAVEKIAREQFGMIGPGETLYRFVRVDSAGPPRAPAPAATP